MNESIEKLAEQVAVFVFNIEHRPVLTEIKIIVKDILAQAINQTREEDKRRIEDWKKQAEAESIVCNGYWEELEKAKAIIHQLESKVLELTEALKSYKPVLTESCECPDSDWINETCFWCKQLADIEALSTTPAADIRERIRVEVIEEFARKVQSISDQLAGDGELGYMAQKTLNNAIESIKKEAN